MPNNNATNDRQWLYSKLKSSGVYVGKSFQEFNDLMDDDLNKDWYAEKIKGLGLDTMQQEQPAQQAQPQQPQAAENPVPEASQPAQVIEDQTAIARPQADPTWIATQVNDTLGVPKDDPMANLRPSMPEWVDSLPQAPARPQPAPAPKAVAPAISPEDEKAMLGRIDELTKQINKKQADAKRYVEANEDSRPLWQRMLSGLTVDEQNNNPGRMQMSVDDVLRTDKDYNALTAERDDLLKKVYAVRAEDAKKRKQGLRGKAQEKAREIADEQRQDEESQSWLQRIMTPAMQQESPIGMSSTGAKLMENPTYRLIKGAERAANAEEIASREIVNAAKDNDTPFGFGKVASQFGRGMANVAAQDDFWTFGASTANDAVTLMGIANKLTDGKKITADEKQMLDASLRKIESEEAYDAVAPAMERFGSIGMQSLPFMLEIGVTGGYANVMEAGSMGGKWLATKGIEKLGEKIGKDIVLGKAATWGVKALGTGLTEAAIGIGFANTTGAMRTQADAINRHIGQLMRDENGNYMFGHYEQETDAWGKPVFDKDGKPKYKAVRGGESWAQAIFHAEMANALEYYTEMLGSHLGVEGIAKGLGKGSEAIGLSKIGNVFNRIANSSAVRGEAGWAKMLKKFGVNDYVGEVMEEEANILLNAMIVHDNQISDLWDGRTQADIWGGMLFSCGAMRAVAAGGNKVIRSVEYSNAKKNLNNASALASARLTQAVWQPLQQRIDNTSNDDLADLAAEIINSPDMLENAKAAVMDYMGKLVKFRGLNQASMVDSQTEAMQQDLDEASPEGQAAARRSQLDSELAAEHSQGAMQAGTPNHVARRLRRASQAVAGIKNIEDAVEWYDAFVGDMSAAERIEQLRQEGATEEGIAQVVELCKAMAAYQGMQLEIANQASAMSTEREERVRMSQGEDGALTQVKMADGTIAYVVGGQVAAAADGTIDKNASSEVISLYDPATGNRWQSNPHEVSAVVGRMEEGDIKPDLERRKEADLQTLTDRANGVLAFAEGEQVIIPAAQEGQASSVTVVGTQGDSVLVLNDQGQPLMYTKSELQALADEAAENEYDAILKEQALARAQQPAADAAGTVTNTEAGTEANADTGANADAGQAAQAGQQQVQPPQKFEVNDEVVLDLDGVQVRGMVSDVMDDGSIEVLHPDAKGEKVYTTIPADKIGEQVVGYKPFKQEQAQQPQPQPVADATGTGTNAEVDANVNVDASQAQQAQAPSQAQQEQAATQQPVTNQATEQEQTQQPAANAAGTEAAPEGPRADARGTETDGALAMIPWNEQEGTYDYEAVEPGLAFEGLVEEMGDEAMARTFAANEARVLADMVEKAKQPSKALKDLEKELKELKKGEIKGNTRAERAAYARQLGSMVAAKQAEIDAAKQAQAQQIAALTESMAKWQAIAQAQTTPAAQQPGADARGTVTNTAVDTNAGQEQAASQQQAATSQANQEAQETNQAPATQEAGPEANQETAPAGTEANAEVETEANQESESENQEQTQAEGPQEAGEAEGEQRNSIGRGQAQGKAQDKGVRSVVDLANAFGRKVVFSGRFIDDQHAGYVDSNGVIHINPNMNVEAQMAAVIGHELTHTAEGTKAYDKLVEFLKGNETFKKWLEGQGYGSLEEFAKDEARYRLEKKQAIEAQAKAEGRKLTAQEQAELDSLDLSEEEAAKEIVADFCGEMIFGNRKFAKEMLSNVKETRSIIERIIDAIRSLIERLVNRGQRQDMQATQDLQTISGMLTDALREARESETRIESKPKNNVFTYWNQHTTDKKGNRKSGRELLVDAMRESGKSQKEINRVVRQMDNLAKLAETLGEGYPQFKFWSETEPVIGDDGVIHLSCVVRNAEYPMNIDFSIICKKKEAATELLDYLVKEGDPSIVKDGKIQLNKDNLRTINNIVKRHGFEMACDLCFVEAKRFNMSNWANSFVDFWNPLVKVAMVAKLKAEGKLPADYNADDFSMGEFNFRGSNEAEVAEDETGELSEEVIEAMRQAMTEYMNQHPEEMRTEVEPLYDLKKDENGNLVPDEDRIFTRKHPVDDDGKEVKGEWLKVYLRAKADGTGYEETGEIEDMPKKPALKEYEKVKGKGKGKVYADKPIVGKMIDLIASPTQGGRARKMLNAADLVSHSGMDGIINNFFELYKIVNIHQGVSKPKSQHGHSPYVSAALTGSSGVSFSKEKAFHIGGVRNQSFSDYEAMLWFDYMQLYADMSALGMPMQVYTKEPAYARLFGMMGSKINLSLLCQSHSPTVNLARSLFQKKNRTDLQEKTWNYLHSHAGLRPVRGAALEAFSMIKKIEREIADMKPKSQVTEEMKALEALLDRIEQNDNLEEWDYNWGDQTFPAKEAFDIIADPKYSANIGTILVAVSDKMMLKALADPRIKMVIPYHKSGLPADVMLSSGVFLYKDFTKWQNDRKIDKQGKKKEAKINFYDCIKIVEARLNGTEVEDVKAFDSKSRNAWHNPEAYSQSVQKVLDMVLAEGEGYTMDDVPMLAGKLFALNAVVNDGIMPRFADYVFEHGPSGISIDKKAAQPHMAGVVTDENGIPKFSKLAETYFKKVEDFNMLATETDEDGGVHYKYHPQKAVEFNLPERIKVHGEGWVTSALPSINEETKVNVVRDGKLVEVPITDLIDENGEMGLNDFIAAHTSKWENTRGKLRTSLADMASDAYRLKALENEIMRENPEWIAKNVKDDHNPLTAALSRWSSQGSLSFGDTESMVKAKQAIEMAINAGANLDNFSTPEEAIERLGRESGMRGRKQRNYIGRKARKTDSGASVRDSANGPLWFSDWSDKLINWTIASVKDGSVTLKETTLEELEEEQRIREELKKDLKARGISARKEYDVDFARKLWSGLNLEESYDDLFNRVADVAERLGIRFRFSNALQIGDGGKYTFGAGAKGGTITLRTYHLRQDGSAQTFCETMLHEMIHSVSTYAIGAVHAIEHNNYYGYHKEELAYAKQWVADNPEVVKAVHQLDAVYEKVENSPTFRRKDGSKMYGATDSMEMIAELSNPEFCEALKKENLWTKIIDAIKRFFGFEKEGSQESDALKLTEQALNTLLEEGYKFDPTTRRNLESEVVRYASAKGSYNGIYTGQDRLNRESTANDRLEGEADGGVRFRDGEEQGRLTDEEAGIVVAAKKDGTYMKAPNGKPTKLNEKQWAQVRTQAFKEWFGDWENNPDEASKVVDENGEPRVVYHGTTNEFYTFDKSRANPESDWGKGFYLTTTEEDVESNYANNEGPDLTNRIESEFERLLESAEWDDELADMTDDELREMARKNLSEGNPRTIPAYVNMKNPVIVGGSNQTIFTLQTPYNEETDEYGETSGTALDFFQALQQACDEMASNAPADIVGSALEYSDDGDYTASQLEHTAKELVANAIDEDGALICNELVRRAFEIMGYDGIIDRSVNLKFGQGRRFGLPMHGVDASTNHMIAFEANQIKSATENNGEFSKENDDIRLREREGAEPKKTVKVYKMMRMVDGELYPLFIDAAAPTKLGQWYDADSPNLEMLKGLPAGNHMVNFKTGETMTQEEAVAQHPEWKLKADQKKPNVDAVNWATENGWRWMEVKDTEKKQSRYGENRAYNNYGINGSGSVETYAMRPGWHAGSLPTMRQIGLGANKNLRDSRFVWVEGRMSADVDYQSKLEAEGKREMVDQIPVDGYYMMATNANKQASQADRVGWYIGGSFVADRVLSDAEAREVIDQWNADPAHADMQVEPDYTRENEREFGAQDPRDAKSKTEAAKALGENLGKAVNVIDSIDALMETPEYKRASEKQKARMKRSQGWINTATGEIFVVIPNNLDVADVRKTILHEVVGHYGLQQLVGKENFANFLSEVFKHADASLRRKITELAQRRGWDYGLATEEFIAGLAEKGFEDMNEQERSLWQAIKELVMKMLNKLVGGEKLSEGDVVSENDLRYMLWRSYQMQTSQGAMAQAENLMKQKELGVGRFAEDAVRFRDPMYTQREMIDAAYKSAKASIANMGFRYGNDPAKLLAARDAVSRFIRKALMAEDMPAMKKMELNSLLNAVKDVKTRGALEKHMRTASNTMFDLDSRAERRTIDRLLGKKILDRNSSGVSVGKGVDDNTRKALEVVKSTLAQANKTDVDNDLHELNRAIYGMRKDMNKQYPGFGNWMDDFRDQQEKAGSTPTDWEGEARRLAGLTARTPQEDQELAGYQLLLLGEERRKLTETRDQMRAVKLEGARAQVEARKKELEALLADPNHDFTEEEASEYGATMLLDYLTQAVLMETTKLTDANGVVSESIASVNAGRERLRQEIADLLEARKKAATQADVDAIDRDIKQKRGELANLDVVETSIKEKQNDLYRTSREMLQMIIGSGAIELKRQVKMEADRRREIAREGYEDIKREGKPWIQYKSDGQRKDLNKRSGWGGFVHKAFGTVLDSFDYMSQAISTSQSGQGYIYRRFMEGEDGIMAAHSNHMAAMRKAKAMLDKKVLDILGEDWFNRWIPERMRAKQFRIEENALRLATERLKEVEQNTGIIYYPLDRDGQPTMTELPCSKGTAMYLYQLWNMADGRMKLAAMGFTEDSMQQVEAFIGPKLAELANWIVQVYYPQLKERTNAKHKEIYHTSMAEVENYVPIKIDPTEFQGKSQMAEGGAPTYSQSLSKKNGSLINRTVNTLAIDLSRTALDVMIEHTDTNEEWIAYARVRQDLDYLLNGHAFRNQMNANKRGSYADFEKACRVAVNMPTGESEATESLLRMASAGLVSGAISFKLYTAAKQILSYPAFYGYSQDPRFMAELTGMFLNFKGNYDWAIENLPSFQKRIEEGLAASSDLARELSGMSDGKFKRFLSGYSKYGMLPNKLVDAITCAAGARAIYRLEMRRLKNTGLSDAEMRQIALRKADIAYNQTQQSNVGAMKSAAQMSHSVGTKLLTTFQQSNIGFTRKTMLAANDIIKGVKNKKRQIELRMQIFGETEEQARKKINNQTRKAVVALALYGWGVKFIWDQANKVAAAIMTGFAGDGGDDDEEDMSLLSATALAGGYLMQGTPVGNLLHDYALGGTYDPLSITKSKEMKEAMKLYEEYGLSPEVATQVVVAAGDIAGIKLDTWSNVAIAAQDLVDKGYDADIAMDIALATNMPKSTREIMMKRRARNYSPLEYAEAMSSALKSEDASTLSHILKGTGPLSNKTYDEWQQDYMQRKGIEGMPTKKEWEEFSAMAEKSRGRRTFETRPTEGIYDWKPFDTREFMVKKMDSIDRGLSAIINKERQGQNRRDVIENLMNLRIANRQLMPRLVAGEEVSQEFYADILAPYTAMRWDITQTRVPDDWFEQPAE